MGENARANSNEQVLSEGEFMFTQDATSGVTTIHSGPRVVTITGQEYPVTFNPSNRKFMTSALIQAVQQNILATQGQYVQVVNPSKDETKKHPPENSKSLAPELFMGEKVNIPGPATFALWPRQHAEVIAGHQLRFNEYLMLRVYDEEKAKANWDSAIIKTAVLEDSEDGKTENKKKTKAKTEVTETSKIDINPKEFTVGKLLILKGTDVSFFIPPTGIEVIKDDQGEYVRKALTLGSLQYCILQDESGEKEYPKGPKVVFPKPTQSFVELTSKTGMERVFRAVELNKIQGIHVKVIQDYEENGQQYKEGDELFLTGTDTPIYIPRHEHSIIRYDGKDKHYAIAVPSGEGRYVLGRMTGKVDMIKGPTMLLPNPIESVVAKRVLSDKQCDHWYPGNEQAKEYNRHLRKIASPTTRKGVVSEGDYLRSLRAASAETTRRNRKGKEVKVREDLAMGVSNVNQDPVAVMADEFTRGSSYTEPRTVTMDTKFDGVPTIELFTGYAVMVVSKSGDRRVEVGPKTILLEYDESLESLAFSTGKPKNTDKLYETSYLRVRNNQVSDRVFAETKDHVNVSLNMSYRVNFEAENDEAREKWFEVDNYIKLLCDHIRSILKNRIRTFDIAGFYNDSTVIIRDVLLGQKNEEGLRNGRFFTENGMRLIDVEVLGVKIDDNLISGKFQEAEHFAVQSAIEIEKATRNLAVTKQQEEIKRETIDERELTLAHQNKSALSQLDRADQLAVKQHENDLKVEENKKILTEKQEAIEAFKNDQLLARQKAQKDMELGTKKALQEVELEKLDKETAAVVAKFNATQGGFTEALVALANTDALEKIAKVSSIQNFIGEGNFTELFKGSNLDSAFQNVLKNSSLSGRLNGGSKPAGEQPTTTST